MSGTKPTFESPSCFFTNFGFFCRFLCFSMPIIALTEAILFGIYAYSNPDLADYAEKRCMVSPGQHVPSSHGTIDSSAIIMTTFKYKFWSNILILTLCFISLLSLCISSC